MMHFCPEKIMFTSYIVVGEVFMFAPVGKMNLNKYLMGLQWVSIYCLNST